MSKMIGVYADWDGLASAKRLGWLHARKARAAELFEYDPAALADPALGRLQIDPRIGLYSGPQFPGEHHDKFGVFADSCPDRWGRVLMRRRLERDVRDGIFPKGTRLFESDYLLGQRWPPLDRKIPEHP